MEFLVQPSEGDAPIFPFLQKNKLKLKGILMCRWGCTVSTQQSQASDLNIPAPLPCPLSFTALLGFPEMPLVNCFWLLSHSSVSLLMYLTTA